MDMRVFLHLIEQADQLARVQVIVDPCLELATIVDQVGKAGDTNRALLFEKVRGTALPVAVNLFGSEQRMAWALGTTDLEALATKLAKDLAATGLNDPEQALISLCAELKYHPAVCSQASCRKIDQTKQGLKFLPQVQSWPGDGGCYLTLAQVITRGYDDALQNCGMYRVQLIDEQHAAVRCRAGSGMMQHLAQWHAAGKSMPVAVVLGGPPVLTWAATAPLPQGVDELDFCGYLTGQRLAVTACDSHDLLVAADAEVVIEGTLDPGAQGCEGPFGNHTGYYDPVGSAPIMKVSRITSRTDAICPWTLVGPPPRENIYMARATARLLVPLMRMALPTLRAIFMPEEGIFHRAALVTVDVKEERPLKELAQILRGTLLLKDARLLVVGADDHDPRDAAGVFWRVLNRVERDQDLLVENGWLTVDARRIPQGEPVRCDPTVLHTVLARWAGYRING